MTQVDEGQAGDGGAGIATPVRAATSDDLQAIVTLEQESFAYPWTSLQVFDELRQPHSLALVVEATAGRISGYLLARSIADEVEILKIGVSRDHRRAGLGRALMTHLSKRLPHARQHLEVRLNSTGAQRFYQSLGFVLTGRRPGYYSNAEDALTMAKRPQQGPPESEPVRRQ